MNLPFDPLRKEILLQLERAISMRRAQGNSFEALGREFGLSREALRLIAERDHEIPRSALQAPDLGDAADQGRSGS
jgi:hypothetical protein